MNRGRRAQALACVFLLLSLWCTRARADDRSKRLEAEQFFRAAEQAYNLGQYDVACVAFEEAYQVLPVPAIAFSTAQAYRLQYFIDKDPARLFRAVELYRHYLEQVTKGGRREDAAANLADLEPIMARVEGSSGNRKVKKLATTRLMISSPVAGARVVLGDVESALPAIREVAPGAHRIRVFAEGYREREQTATAVEGSLLSVEVALEELPAAVVVRTESAAEIAVDGRAVATTPLRRPLALPAGTHWITVSRRGREAWGREVTLERGKEAILEAPLEITTKRHVAGWLFATAGLTTVAAGVVGAYAWKAGSSAEEVDLRRGSVGLLAVELDDYERHKDRRDRLRTLSWRLVGVASVLGAAGALAYYFDMPRASEVPAATSIDVRADSSGASVWIEGTL